VIRGRPTQTALRHGEAAAWGRPPAPSAAKQQQEILKWTPFRNAAGTLLGFFGIEFADRPTRDRFNQMLLDLLRADHPEAFEP
jgi:hypothetical protein